MHENFWSLVYSKRHSNFNGPKQILTWFFPTDSVVSMVRKSQFISVPFRSKWFEMKKKKKKKKKKKRFTFTWKKKKKNERCERIINITCNFCFHSIVMFLDIVIFLGRVITYKLNNAVTEVLLTFYRVQCKCRGSMTRSRWSCSGMDIKSRYRPWIL